MKKKTYIDYFELEILADRAGLLTGEIFEEKEIFSYILEKSTNPFSSLSVDLDKLRKLGFMIKSREKIKIRKTDKENIIRSLFRLEDKLDKIHASLVNEISQTEDEGEEVTLKDKQIKRIIGRMHLTVLKACELLSED